MKIADRNRIEFLVALGWPLPKIPPRENPLKSTASLLKSLLHKMQNALSHLILMAVSDKPQFNMPHAIIRYRHGKKQITRTVTLRTKLLRQIATVP